MNAPPDLRLPKQEFDRWVSRQRERFEWTVRNDLIQKCEKSNSQPSVVTCVVLSRDEPIVRVWQRSAETGRLPSKSEEIPGTEGALALTVLGLSLPLADIYQSLGPR